MGLSQNEINSTEKIIILTRKIEGYNALSICKMGASNWKSYSNFKTKHN